MIKLKPSSNWKKKKTANEDDHGTVRLNSDDLLEALQNGESIPTPKLDPSQQRSTKQAGKQIEPLLEQRKVGWRFKTPQSKALIKIKFILQQWVFIFLVGYILYSYSQNNSFESRNYTLHTDRPFEILIPIVLIFVIWKFRNHFRLFGGLPKKSFKLLVHKDYVEFKGQKYDRKNSVCQFIMTDHARGEYEAHTDKDSKTFFEGRFQYRSSRCIYLMHDFNKVLIAEIYGEGEAKEIYADLCMALQETEYRYV